MSGREPLPGQVEVAPHVEGGPTTTPRPDVERRPIALAEIEQWLPGMTRRWRRDLVTGAIEIGGLLIDAKEQVGNGGWLEWLRQHFPDSERTARRFMQLVREVKSANLADLP